MYFPCIIVTLQSNMEQQRQHVPTELGTKNMGALLWQYALPAIIAMTASSLYNNVDRIFIGQGVGAMAISGLATTFPFMNLSAALGAMVGVGASTVISVRLGQKDHRTAQLVLGNAVTLNIIIGTLFTIACWPFLDEILYLFGASSNTLPYAREYMEVILLGNIITHSYFGLNAILRAAGHPKIAMQCTMLAVLANVILDPLFIWGFEMGIRGAAWATILSQVISLIWQIQVFSRPNELLRFQRGIYRPRLNIIRQTLAIGLSPFLMNCCACLVVLITNRGLSTHGGDHAIGAYGIMNSVMFLFIMVIMGLNQGMQPIAGYNWGAHQNHRVWQVLRYTMGAATFVSVIGFVVAQYCPHLMVRLFTDDPTIMEMAIRGFHITAALFPIVGPQMVVGNFFQSIGHAGKSIFMSLSRQLIFFLPLLIILPDYWGLDGVWAAQAISDGISFFVASGMLCYLVLRIRKKEKRNIAYSEQKNE